MFYCLNNYYFIVSIFKQPFYFLYITAPVNNSLWPRPLMEIKNHVDDADEPTDAILETGNNTPQ